MHASPLIWLVLGALMGVVIVSVAHSIAGLEIEPWLASVITTITAVVVASVGPTERHAEATDGGIATA